ncbi:unnamed protein product [Ceratitis capitata]|uniref:(Mediterranean fruit fly) hypothetical protein n=1 Tax=Ceratitis capitata TaxID=7213 RepID=A0A811UYV6_CERCA|nr:unnamed protein product [Ceratitis capitata]
MYYGVGKSPKTRKYNIMLALLPTLLNLLSLYCDQPPKGREQENRQQPSEYVQICTKCFKEKFHICVKRCLSVVLEKKFTITTSVAKKESSSDDSSSDEKRAAVVPAVKKNVVSVKAKKASSSSEDSSSEDEHLRLRNQH